MVYIIFGKNKIGRTLAGIVAFIICEIIIGGAVVALGNLFSFAPKSTSKTIAIILFVGGCVTLIFPLFQNLTKRRLKEISLTAKIEYHGKEARTLLFVDSGNMARESISGRRIIFIREGAIREIMEEMKDLNDSDKCVEIPINTATGKGTVVGFIPDKIQFSDKKYNYEEFVVVSDKTGCNFGGYDGIAPLV